MIPEEITGLDLPPPPPGFSVSEWARVCPGLSELVKKEPDV